MHLTTSITFFTKLLKWSSCCMFSMMLWSPFNSANDFPSLSRGMGTSCQNLPYSRANAARAITAFASQEYSLSCSRINIVVWWAYCSPRPVQIICNQNHSLNFSLLSTLTPLQIVIIYYFMLHFRCLYFDECICYLLQNVCFLIERNYYLILPLPGKKFASR